MADEQITQLLHEWVEGDDDALEELTPLVYGQLKALATRIFSGESAGHTLQPTALVHEAFDQLVSADVDWQDRNHFYALSARMMRRILVNHAKARQTAKRGGEALRVTFTDFAANQEESDGTEVLALDAALKDLQEFDERKAKIVELYYFGGLTYSELANVTGVAESTVHLDLRTARAWLQNSLAPA